MADVVLYHHVPWNEYELYRIQHPELTQMLSVADHCDLYLIRHEPFLNHIEAAFPSHQYHKDTVDLMVSVLQNQDYVSKTVQKEWMHQFMDSLVFDEEEILRYLRLISFSIDSQSKHMVAHTITTTSISKTLAKLYHLSPVQIKKVEYGALLHDIGKVATPVSILEKPGKLNAEEMAIMRQHVVHSIHILQGAIDQDIVMTCDNHFNDIMDSIEQDCVPILRSYQNIESEYEDLLRVRNKR